MKKLTDSVTKRNKTTWRVWRTLIAVPMVSVALAAATTAQDTNIQSNRYTDPRSLDDASSNRPGSPIPGSIQPPANYQPLPATSQPVTPGIFAPPQSGSPNQMGVIQQNVVNQRPADFLNVTANLQQDPNSASNSNEITQRYNAGDLIAIVGTQPVLEGEIASVVDPILEKNKDRIREQDLDGIRSKLSREALTHRIETLALAQHFVSGLSEGGSTKEQAEFKKKILPKLVEAFHTQVVPARMKQAGVNTPNELDAELRKSGSSLASLLVQFQDQILAEEAINSSVPKKVNVTLADLRDYYANHTEEWAKPARAKWRQITVKFSNHASREEAFEAIKQYGNEVILGGAPFEAVAKKYSEDFSSTDGGLYEWVTQGSLKSKEIDSTVFAIPLEKSSEIIEDEVGYHIVIVLDREDARLISMSEAQLDMQQKIQTTRKDELKRELIEKVMAKTAIWSRWPDDFANAKPLSEAILQR